MKPRMEVLIEDDRLVKLEGEQKSLFAVVRALKEYGFDPKIRVIDPETDDWTCWQPTATTVHEPKKGRKRKNQGRNLRAT